MDLTFSSVLLDTIEPFFCTIYRKEGLNIWAFARSPLLPELPGEAQTQVSDVMC